MRSLYPYPYPVKDREVVSRINSKYSTVVRSALMYGVECWPIRRKHILGKTKSELKRDWDCSAMSRDEPSMHPWGGAKGSH